MLKEIFGERADAFLADFLPTGAGRAVLPAPGTRRACGEAWRQVRMRRGLGGRCAALGMPDGLRSSGRVIGTGTLVTARRSPLDVGLLGRFDQHYFDAFRGPASQKPGQAVLDLGAVTVVLTAPRRQDRAPGFRWLTPPSSGVGA